MEGNENIALDMQNFDGDKNLEKDWARKFRETTQEIYTKGLTKWCQIVDKIGEPKAAVNSHMIVFERNFRKLFDDLIFDMEIIHDKVLDKITELLENIEKQCKDLQIEIPNVNYENMSLVEVYNELKKNKDKYEEEILTRQLEVAVLNETMIETCKCFGRRPKLLSKSKLPSKEEIIQFAEAVESLKIEKLNRLSYLRHLKTEITSMLDNLKIEPDEECMIKLIASEVNENLINDDFVDQLECSLQRLSNYMKNINREIGELREAINDLWIKLDVPFAQRFSCEGSSPIVTLELLKKERERLEKLKMEHIKYLVDKERNKLKALWQKCFLNAAEQIERFTAYNSTCYNEDLLELFELEVDKLTNCYNKHKDLYSNLEEHEKLWLDYLELEEKVNLTNRFENRGGRLLQEEKERNRLLKRIPKVEAKLLAGAQKFKAARREEFLLNGKTIETYLQELHLQHENEKKLKLSAKKQERELALSILPSPSLYGSAIKRKLLATPRSAIEASKKFKVTQLKAKSSHLTLSTKKASELPKFNVVKAKRLAQAKRRRSSSLSFNSPNKENNHNSLINGNCPSIYASTPKRMNLPDYKYFEEEVSKRSALRSTEIGPDRLVTPRELKF